MNYLNVAVVRNGKQRDLNITGHQAMIGSSLIVAGMDLMLLIVLLLCFVSPGLK